MTNDAVHDVEAFGPVSTLMPYGDFDEALALAARGRGSLVATLVTHDPKVAAKAIPQMAAWHGRLHILDREAAAESTGHGSPLPMLKHGGPGRAGGGEELGGIRAVKHYLQRAAVQGSPTMLMAVTGEYVRGAALNEGDVHPFRKHFEELAVGDSLLTHRRTVSEADIVAFGGISGDFFYMHFDEIAAKESAFGKRIAHGYFVLSAAAGLFVSPAPGPVLANYGLDTLRFVKPVGDRRHDPRPPHLQAQDRPQPEGRARQGPGRRRLGRGGHQPGRRAGRELRHPDARRQARRLSRTRNDGPEPSPARPAPSRRLIMPNRTSRRSLLQSTGLLVAGSASPGLAMLAGCAATPAPMAETTMQEMTASDALSRIRSGRMSAEAYVVAMLDRAERLKDLERADLGRPRRRDRPGEEDRRDARRRRAAAGARRPADRRQGQHQQPRPADHRRHRGAARRAADGQRADAAEAGRRRRDRHRQGEPARARLRHHQHQPHQLRRRGEEPVRPDPHSRRLVGRHRGGDRRAHRPGRARHRHRRLDPHPGRALRHRRPAPLGRQRRRRAPLRRRRRGADQPHPRHGRADGPHRRRRRPARRGHHRRAADLLAGVADGPPDRHPGVVLGRARSAGRRGDGAGADPARRRPASSSSRSTSPASPRSTRRSRSRSRCTSRSPTSRPISPPPA